ncbi:MAG: molybdate transporter ATP-binding protein [Gammaproteobacteria bacterium]|jgi:molybdate transport system ATP-binding protein|nr:molybdate transporter ATP-binding protein [Gammaproteobacteria bacterium]
MLKVRVVKQRDGFTLDANFEAPTPGVVALFGRSGCGKTTTIDIISGLLGADEAHIELDGQVLEDTGGVGGTRSGTDAESAAAALAGARRVSRAQIRVPPERRRIGYVFQDGRLFPHMSVLRNLRYGMTRAEHEPRGATAAAGTGQRIELEPIVSLLGLERLLQRRPYQLSGGERQRVSLGRALLSQPRLLLLDEPLAALDAARREEVLPYLEKLRDNLSIPMVYVSHQFDEVLRLATHVVLMDAGRVLAQGTLNEVSLVPSLRDIVGPDSVGAVLDGMVTGVDASAGMADLRVGNGVLNVSVRSVTVGEHVRVQLLARDIILAVEAPRGLSVRNELQGIVVELVEDEEEAVLVTVDVGGAHVLSRVTRSAVGALGLRVGTGVWVLVKAVSTRGHAFRVPGL